MYFIHNLKFKYFARIGLLLFWISVFLLLCVLFFGININGASRWLSVGGQQFQPSDIAKLAIIMYLCRQISKYRLKIKKLKGLFLYLLLPASTICLLVLPNNFSTSALIFSNVLLLLFLSNIDLKHISLIILSSIFISSSIYFSTKYSNLEDLFPRSQTWVNRIDSFFDKKDDKLNKDYQVTQALIAVKKGGILGLGPGKSVQRDLLPYSYSDFIFAIMIEEYGLFFGAILPILLYLILLYRSIIIYLKTESVFGSLLAVSLVFSLVIQAFVNMLVAVNILPVTGQTLPLISMGGTSILFTCFSIGVVLSISRDSNDREYDKE
jgi:cell division protein FtsW